MTRVVVRLALVAATTVALWVAGLSVFKLGANDPITWATLSAALAVLAAVTSAWTSQRVVEMQEDNLAPNPVPSIDLRSRYGLAQFRITNRGGSPAHDIRLKWDRPLTNAEGQDVVLGSDAPIPLLGPGENASVLLGGSHTFIQKVPDTTCCGTITFADGAGRRRSSSFMVSAEHERKALSHDEERTKTEHELQRVPDALKKIAEEIRRLSTIVERTSEDSAEPSNNQMQRTGPGEAEPRR